VISKAQDQGTKRVGLWIRVSTEDQVKGESPEHHERRARAYAESREWEVVEVFRLEAVSGKSVMEHPDTKRMLDHVHSGYIDGLIFSKLARLARNTKELLEFSEIFQECGADLISLQESIDTSTPAGRLFYTVIAAMAQWEREEIAERVAASVPIRAKMGKSLGGQAPLGYQWVDQKLIPRPDEVPVRRQVYELFREHKRKKTVARLLNEAGYRTRSGKKFSDSTVERLIEDPTAKGWRRANYSKSLGPNKHWVYKPESEWILTPVEPIISEELWNECHQILEEQRSKRGRPAKKPVHLFAGLAVCSCGQKMYVPSNSPKYTCSKCRNKIPIEDLEAIYYEQLKGFLLSPDEIGEFMEQANATLSEKVALLKSLELQANSVKTEMDRLYDLYIHGEIQRDGFGKRYHPLEEQSSQLEDEIPRLLAEIDFLKINYLSDDRVLTDAQSLYTQWPMLVFEDRRSIVEAITEEIIIGNEDGEIEIGFGYFPSYKDAVDRQRNFKGYRRRRA
jgi:site-specific DNA recombinase